MRTRSATRALSEGSARPNPATRAHSTGNNITRANGAKRRTTQPSLKFTDDADDSDDQDYVDPPAGRPIPRKTRAKSPSKRTSQYLGQSMMAQQVAKGMPGADSPKNPNPDMYMRGKKLKDHERIRSELSGIKESIWIPKEAGPAEFEKRSLRDLKGYIPTRLEFTTKHTEQDKKDEWYEMLIHHLYLRVKEFAQKNFDNDSIWSAFPTSSPWAEDFSPQFINLASQVARADPLIGGWDAVLILSKERALVVMGVIAKVLEANVFSELLFGEHKNGKDDESKHGILSKMDEQMMNEEGYYRKASRCNHVRFLLQDKIVTPYFWDEVDRLATQTTAMLLPLINWQGSLGPAEQGFERPVGCGWPRLVAIHQEIHNIIAQAGFIAICMSWSTSIFSITFPEPGDRWNLDQNHMDGFSWEESKKRSDVKDARQPSESKPIRRMAKVKIVAWPLVKRHKPLGQAKGFGAPDGERISKIFLSQVVYYNGRLDDKGEREERFSLQEHVTGERKARWNDEWGHGILFFIAVILSLFLLGYLVRDVREGASKTWFLFQKEGSYFITRSLRQVGFSGQ